MDRWPPHRATNAELWRRMLGDHDPQEFIGYILPIRWRYAEKLAINAVMAGCKPVYLPVIIAGVEAMLTEIFNLHGVQSTTHMSTPAFVVNGPIAHALNINSKAGCLGSGFRANATIGRALRLVMMNLGVVSLGKRTRRPSVILASTPISGPKMQQSRPGNLSMSSAVFELRKARSRRTPVSHPTTLTTTPSATPFRFSTALLAP